jgi:hypothetical protein
MRRRWERVLLFSEAQLYDETCGLLLRLHQRSRLANKPAEAPYPLGMGMKAG